MAYPRAAQVQRLAAHVKRRPLEIVCLAPEGDHRLQSHEPSSAVDLVRIPRALPTRILERILPARKRSALREYDVRYLWWRLAARHLLKRRPSADDVLVTFGQPMVDHLAGLAVKKCTGVRWIAHFSDPWADNPFDPKANTKRNLERSVIEAADRVVFTSEETVDLVMSKYPETFRRKVAVLPHSFDPRVYPDVQPTGPFTIVRYLGNLFAGRGPDALLQALTIMQDRSTALLENVRFEFIGDTAEAARNHPLLSGLPPQCIRFCPKVSYADAMALMASADLLLNIDAPANLSVFLPSKLVEYVGAARPIFGITPEGTAKRLIEGVGGWTADPINIAQIADNLARALSNVMRFRETKWGNADVRQRYAASNVAAAFEDIVDVVVAG